NELLGNSFRNAEGKAVIDNLEGKYVGLYFSAPSGGTIHYTTDGSDPRLPGGAVNPAAQSLTITSGSTTLVASGTAWKYLDDGSNQGGAWKDVGFNDSSWSSGNALLGYGNGGEATTVSYGNNGSNKHVTTYFRKTFSVSNVGSLTSLTLELVRDDGAVVYLNGEEIQRTNMPSGTINYNTLANGAIGGSGETAFNQFSVDLSKLVEGNNTIAVEIHQASFTSSDISFDLRLLATNGSSSPDLTLSSDTLLNARVLSGGTWSAIHPAQFIVSQPPVAPALGDLVISELHYHPAEPTTAELAAISSLSGDDFEFLELMNISSNPLRLDGCVFSDGIDYIFPEDSIIQPGGRLVLVKNESAFSLRHSSSIPHGSFSGGLKNSGEQIVLQDASATTILDFTYGDGTDRGGATDALWPSKPDGSGESLVLIHPSYGINPNNPLLWRASMSNHGAPGGTDAVQLALPNSDDDEDGHSVLLERTLNSLDTDGSAQPVITGGREMIDGNEYLTLSFVRNSQVEAHIQVQTSTSLSGWLNDAVLLERQINPDGTELLKYRFPTPTGASANKQFMRVQVAQ
ncbi:MAG: lamin tail domain-containing protein, partial [Akkermansiaceae bacterium]